MSIALFTVFLKLLLLKSKEMVAHFQWAGKVWLYIWMVSCQPCIKHLPLESKAVSQGAEHLLREINISATASLLQPSLTSPLATQPWTSPANRISSVSQVIPWKSIFQVCRKPIQATILHIRVRCWFCPWKLWTHRSSDLLTPMCTLTPEQHLKGMSHLEEWQQEVITALQAWYRSLSPSITL